MIYAPAHLGPRDGRIANAMTVDVEDYFQVQAFFDHIDRKNWDGHRSRVERNVDEILQLFSDANVKGTFFTLGWIAERHPQMVRRIVAAGHELASHGYAHFRADGHTPDEFRNDVRKTRKILEDTGGTSIKGYRAASFSIGKKNLWAFQVLAEEGHIYSSSVYPIRHDLYGMPDAPRFSFHPIANSSFIEIPVTTNQMMGMNLPCGGGGYFRLLPYGLSTWQMRRVNRRDRQPCMFYFHPWEIDPQQPVQEGVSLKTRVRHYTNLSKMRGRLKRLLGEFAWGRMDEVFAVDRQQNRAA
jgi:polysaccharide deacetylase family protein (PEP-CTERM system associated)